MRILDTTLRDGEQSPGATLTAREKLDIAKQLAKLGVDVIEAGFPISSPADFEAVKAIAIEVGNDVQVGCRRGSSSSSAPKYMVGDTSIQAAGLACCVCVFK